MHSRRDLREILHYLYRERKQNFDVREDPVMMMTLQSPFQRKMKRTVTRKMMRLTTMSNIKVVSRSSPGGAGEASQLHCSHTMAEIGFYDESKHRSLTTH